ncbi:Dyp-type peroxidase [uncultured Agrococcus sp.]|uniref:Dyp-type peroxidase n=1 Tax=uncultured Agrococcus sp. TaxID=382258 RepID=UPI0025E3CF97|nr:Dyp-type peroxidase [uncultured Agrococcus sp.]
MAESGSPSRRQFLLGGAAAATAGVAIGIGADRAVLAAQSAAEAPHGETVEPFFGAHQAGIATDAQAYATLLAFDLREETDKAALRRMMSILTDDAARLTQGIPALADSEPELALHPARLTITFGFGPEFVTRAEGSAPAWLAPLPSFRIDALQEEYSHGDFFVQVASDDPTTAAHAVRMIVKDTRGFAAPRWQQRGFRHSHGTFKPGVTMRNLFGQVDGTGNTVPGTDDFDYVVWSNDGWLAGGTSLVLRRIRMDLDTWDHVGRSDRELSVGRRLDNGAPLTGEEEHDALDLSATDAGGRPVIPPYAHARRARSDDPRERIFRRGYNYDDPPEGGGDENSGQLFMSFQADVDAQFVPLQRRLEELDLLNLWTTPIGSSVFAIPPGCQEGGYVGETLLE